ncbi:MAG: hypothetical protein ABSF77_18600 [Spirochaetia bacterium]|jgi:hypothetical protein
MIFAVFRSPYRRKLLRLLRHRQLPPPGAVLDIDVIHDPACALAQGKGPCNCDPDIELPGLPGQN